MSLDGLISSTEDLIDKVMVFHHQLRPDRIAEGGPNDTLRKRITFVAQRKLAIIHTLRDWSYRYVSHAAVVIDTAGEGDLPSGWGNEGQDGGVWLDPAVNNRRLVWNRLGVITNRRETGTETGEPESYSVRGLREIIVWPLPVAQLTVYVQYVSAVPELTDGDAGGLDAFPEQWRDSVLYEMVVEEEMLHKGNLPGLPVQQKVVREALFMMCCEERQGKPEVATMPRYAGSADVFGGY